ncbi:type IV toxin-antitoxin system AbiEi family antitoxin domain-containing protein [Microlunatus sp. GCM10028923]|uniref:type IV toxin-antitoxin system AbiEi family antitoxin domain-containing protein n=1 Tax=Microlunatus sp. GCM10028923 TaxID=3273400 RepID=UPI003623AD35
MTSMEGVVDANGGFITRAQALDCGITDRELGRAVRDGGLVRVRHGLYVPAEIHDRLDRVGRHALLARAVVAIQRGRAALWGPSAAATYGLELLRSDLDVVHLLRLDDATVRTVAGVKHHVMSIDDEQDLIERDGILITSLARTAWDVARTSSLEGGVITIDSALRLDPDMTPRLLEISAASAHHPRVRAARTAVSLADGRAANGGESFARVRFYRYGVPRPELQVPVYDAAGYKIGTTDFAWEEHRHVAEFDGKIKYQRYLKPGESPGDAVFREKRREDAIRRTGRGVSRLVWSDLLKPQVRSTMMMIREDLEHSHRLYVQRPQAS